MKSSGTPQEQTSNDDSERENTQRTPTQAPSRPVATTRTSSSTTIGAHKSSSLSIPPDQADDSGDQEREEPTDSDSSIATSDGTEDEQRGVRSASRDEGQAKSKGPIPTPPTKDLAQLKDALNARMLAQNRARRSYGPSPGARSEPKRVSPIKEEESPSLSAVVSGQPPNPVRTTSTISTESTESTESNRTIKGSVPATPAAGAALRTPSYPFPYVPGTPKFGHRPFTALSPTGRDEPKDDHDTPGRAAFELLSGGSTPAANSSFMPAGEDFNAPDDPRYPTPNLYDLVLQLTSEPGLEQWWATVTNMLHDHYHAERATLIQPIDPNDMENVPWGQKATFSMNGEDLVPQQTEQQPDRLQRPEFTLREPSNESRVDDGPQKLHPERLRPRLESRHSYAGHGTEVRNVLGTLNEPGARTPKRPPGPQRLATHASGMTPEPSPGRMMPPRLPSGRFRTTESEMEFSSIGAAAEKGPHAEIFSSLRGLDHEARPLIETGGVGGVLERGGRVVAITRNYVRDAPQPGLSRSAPSESFFAKPRNSFGNYRSVFASDDAPVPNRDYQEYEQYPSSPWAQSPAPSPAIQSDEEQNPFFVSDDQVDDSFNPAVSPKDYADFRQVEAIGVDHASTVIHIPLVHPLLSQAMSSLSKTPQSKGTGKLQRSSTVDEKKKVPIAILSILTSAVPYPSNLTQSLKLLGPHLATSFAIAQQFSAVHVQAVAIKHRRTASGHHATVAPMTIEPLSDILSTDLEQPIGTGSMTSPSEYSSRSRASPSSSIVGTPGWDPAAHGWTASRSVAGTPALTGTEIVQDYFESKKRSGHRSGSVASTSNTPAKQARKGSGADSKTTTPEDGSKPLHGERKTKSSSSRNKEEKLPPAERSPPQPTESVSPLRRTERPSMPSLPDYSLPKQHSLLHSYGADFGASIGVSPVSTPGDIRTPGGLGHLRKNSYPEDMPPPSERLLRTIIDSVPVQIFTAQPETGELTWVNSKFLIYRGQEPRQVLSDPWSAIHPDERGDFLPAWHRSLRTLQQLQQKVRIERFDHTYRWFYIRAAPLKDKRGKTVHWIGTMMDFHEQHLAEQKSARQQETEASEAKYRALANSSPQIVFAVSRSKGVTFCNTQWVQYSGQTESQSLGTGFMDHVHPDDLAKCRLPTFDDGSTVPTNVPTSMPPEPKRTVSQSATSSDDSEETERAIQSPGDSGVVSPITGRPPQRKLSELASTGILKVSKDADGRPSYSTEVRLKSKDGNYRWHLVRVLLADPMFNHEKEETWYGTCTDINDHKTLERNLKETMDEKSRFLSNMSHEIRTPLNGITGMVNFLIDSDLTAEQMEHVNIIRASTEGLRGLINDILDLSKAEAGMIQLNMDWLYPQAVIEEVNDLTSAMAIDKGLELNYIVQDDVPAQIKADRFRVRQILLNVVGNAIKFTSKGEVFIRCCVQKSDGELAKNETFIRFEVVDTGRGFNDKEAEFLFKRFSQIDGSSTRQHGGTGLGLVISKQLAQLHGGDMSARGIPEKGSTFCFYIKTTVPSRMDQPPPPTPGVPGLTDMSNMQPGVPMSPGPVPTPTAAAPSLTKMPTLPFPPELPHRPTPKLLQEITQSPQPVVGSPGAGRESPSVSSASSDPSVRSAARTSSLRSERSSASSFIPADQPTLNEPMKLALPQNISPSPKQPESSSSNLSGETVKASAVNLTPPMFSILVIAPLKYSREATVEHIDKTLPKNVPHQITARQSFEECKSMLDGDDPVIFTHVVVVLQDVDEIVALMNKILNSANSSIAATAIVLITDLAQRKKIMEQAPDYNYEELVEQQKLRFVFKPLKPSRFGLIFDPQKERELSLDRNQDSAAQQKGIQNAIYAMLSRALAHKNQRVLLVEDNRVNQMVIIKFLGRAHIKVDLVVDGKECVDKVFSNPHGHYAIILCDLHMPNKDGYQTCKEIRKWEKKNKYASMPIVALSANVLGDVWDQCVEAGFNEYLTKPVDFKELGGVMMKFLDCEPDRKHEFMKLKSAENAPESSTGK